MRRTIVAALTGLALLLGITAAASPAAAGVRYPMQVTKPKALSAPLDAGRTWTVMQATPGRAALGSTSTKQGQCTWLAATVGKIVKWTYGGPGLASSQHNWSTVMVLRGSGTKVKFTLRDVGGTTCQKDVAIP